VALAPKSHLHLMERSTIVSEDWKADKKFWYGKIAGAMARRIVTYSKDNDKSGTGPSSWVS